MLRAPPSRTREQPAPAVAEARGVVHSVASLGRRVPRAWLLGIGGGLLVLLIAGFAAFGPMVRSRVAKEGARRRLEVTVGSVRPGFFAVGLKDVHVKLQGVPGIEVRLDEVRVDLSAGLSVRDVAGHG